MCHVAVLRTRATFLFVIYCATCAYNRLMPAKLYDEKTVHVTLRIPESLMVHLEALAKSERRTKSQMSVFALEIGIERLLQELERKSGSISGQEPIEKLPEQAQPERES